MSSQNADHVHYELVCVAFAVDLVQMLIINSTAEVNERDFSDEFWGCLVMKF